MLKLSLFQGFGAVDCFCVDLNKMLLDSFQQHRFDSAQQKDKGN